MIQQNEGQTNATQSPYGLQAYIGWLYVVSILISVPVSLSTSAVFLVLVLTLTNALLFIEILNKLVTIMGTFHTSVSA